MEKIEVSKEILDKARAHCEQYFPLEKVANHPSHRFWVEGSNPNLQGLIGELAFVSWLDCGMTIDQYLEQRPVFKRDKGKDLVIGRYKIDVKTPALRVTPKPYHKFLVEDALVENKVADLYVFQFLIKPEMTECYVMGFATPSDLLALGEKKQKGDVIYGKVTAGYNGYLMPADLLGSPDELKLTLKGLTCGDILTTA